ncbi:MAG: hypothetical protein R2910_02220 [Gemmatimonadales bacterium]|jgi:hypothetical protein
MANMMMAGLVAINFLACGQGAPAGTAAKAAANPSLANGTTIDVTTSRTITSRSDKEGASLMTTVDADVKNSAGRVVIPAGSTVELVITEISPAKTKSAKDGTLTLRVAGVTVGGQTYPLAADITSISHSLKGRGVTVGEVEKVAAGTAIGAVAGRIIGGDSKGTIIGAAVGTAGGAVVANETASRDVVIDAGSPIELTLTGPLTLAAR